MRLRSIVPAALRAAPVSPGLRIRALAGIVCLAVLLACSRQEGQLSSGDGAEFGSVAETFAKALGGRDYAAAYELTSVDYRDGTSLTDMQAAFEAIVPLDWKTVGPVELGATMTDWPGKQPSDAGWAYVSR